MFGNDDESIFGDSLENIRSRRYRSQEEECDFCESSEGSVVVDREENNPDVPGSPPVVRCRECFNDPETYNAG